MKNPFSRRPTKPLETVADSGGCCAPLEFTEEPDGDTSASEGCCAPLVFEEEAEESESTSASHSR